MPTGFGASNNPLFSQMYDIRAAGGRQRRQLNTQRELAEKQAELARERLAEQRRQFDVTSGQNKTQFEENLGQRKKEFQAGQDLSYEELRKRYGDREADRLFREQEANKQRQFTTGQTERGYKRADTIYERERDRAIKEKEIAMAQSRQQQIGQAAQNIHTQNMLRWQKQIDMGYNPPPPDFNQAIQQAQMLYGGGASTQNGTQAQPAAGQGFNYNDYFQGAIQQAPSGAPEMIARPQEVQPQGPVTPTMQRGPYIPSQDTSTIQRGPYVPSESTVQATPYGSGQGVDATGGYVTSLPANNPFKSQIESLAKSGKLDEDSLAVMEIAADVRPGPGYQSRLAQAKQELQSQVQQSQARNRQKLDSLEQGVAQTEQSLKSYPYLAKDKEVKKELAKVKSIVAQAKKNPEKLAEARQAISDFESLSIEKMEPARADRRLMEITGRALGPDGQPLPPQPLSTRDYENPLIKDRLKSFVQRDPEYKSELQRAKAQTRESIGYAVPGLWTGTAEAMFENNYPEIAEKALSEYGSATGNNAKAVYMFEKIVTPLLEGDFSKFPSLANLDSSAQDLAAQEILKDAENQMRKWVGLDVKESKVKEPFQMPTEQGPQPAQEVSDIKETESRWKGIPDNKPVGQPAETPDVATSAVMDTTDRSGPLYDNIYEDVENISSAKDAYQQDLNTITPEAIAGVNEEPEIITIKDNLSNIIDTDIIDDILAKTGQPIQDLRIDEALKNIVDSATEKYGSIMNMPPELRDTVMDGIETMQNKLSDYQKLSNQARIEQGPPESTSRNIITRSDDLYRRPRGIEQGPPESTSRNIITISDDLYRRPKQTSNAIEEATEQLLIEAGPYDKGLSTTTTTNITEPYSEPVTRNSQKITDRYSIPKRNLMDIINIIGDELPELSPQIDEMIKNAPTIDELDADLDRMLQEVDPGMQARLDDIIAGGFDQLIGERRLRTQPSREDMVTSIPRGYRPARPQPSREEMVEYTKDGERNLRKQPSREEMVEYRTRENEKKEKELMALPASVLLQRSSDPNRSDEEKRFYKKLWLKKTKR